ncbi:C6 zinc finger domain-containing protein [Ilyonectria destructans]|nr:C6 zinc finger domain-containing protein [Ilyonectria destructans]
MDGLSVGLENPPTTRRQIQRVKTGCRTCKARRVKCDEHWPSCLRCTSSGRECDGYGVWGGGHPSRPTAQCLDLHRPSNTGPAGRLNAEDRRVLEWCLLAKLQGVFPFPFWESLVPQACHNEPVILSCVLALGSVHKRAFIDEGSTNSEREVNNLESITLRHYNTAINLLNGSQSDGSRVSTQVTLIACLTFVIIEYLQKRQYQGLIHLQHGLQILGSQKYNNMQQSSRDPVEDWLAEAFGRLDIQSRLLFNTTTDNQSRLNNQASKRPLTLRSLHEARQQLDLLVSEAFRLQRQGRIAESSTNISRLFQALIIQQQLQEDLSSWLQAYRAWRTRPPPSLLQPPSSLPEQLARRLLLIYHTMASIITATALYSGDESVFDQHILQFASIIALSKDILKATRFVFSGRVSSHGHCNQTFSFTSDIGLIPPLYYTALKCLDPRMRWDALSILETETHREGIWDGPTAALIAGEIHGEEGVTNGRRNSTPPDSPVPQLWRVSDIQVEPPHSPEMELVLVCRRKLGDGTWTVIKRRHKGFHWY